MKHFSEVISNFNKIYIQTHNFPDADSIASAWGMKRLIEHLGKQAQVIYYGNVKFKPNIGNMMNKYKISMTSIDENYSIGDDELLIVVDGQYGAGNVLKVQAENVVIIDHHLEDRPGKCLYKDIQPKIGACATIVLGYLKHFCVPIDKALATIMYFGIFMDTDMFTGRITTLDNDAKKELELLYDKKIIDQLRLSSMSFDDLRIYANAILSTERYNSIIFTSVDTCEDNLLGHISDLLSELDGIEIVVVYSPRQNGYKLSVRSYHDYLTAEEIVKALVQNIGTGGGHQNKAGGYISSERFELSYRKVSIGIYIRTTVIDYFRDVQLLINGKDDPMNIFPKSQFFKARKRKIYLRYFNVSDYFEENVTIKTLEGLETATINDIVIIGVANEVWPISAEVFDKKYIQIEDKETKCYSDDALDEYGITIVSNAKLLRITKDNIKQFNVCLTNDDVVMSVIKLNEIVKVRSNWGDYLAKKGDYLIYDNINDYYICDKDIFEKTYEIVE